MATLTNTKYKEVVGSMSPVWTCKAVIVAADASDNTFDIVTGLRVIEYVNVFVVDSGNRHKAHDYDITFSGGTITIADGSDALTAGDIMYVMAVGVPKA